MTLNDVMAVGLCYLTEIVTARLWSW